MATRRDALRRIDTELKNLSKKVPEGEELFAILLALADPEHKPAALDRTAAIASAAFLEHALETAIIRYLKPNLSDRERKDLFDNYGPLGSFSAKIIAAIALGVIDNDDRENLDTIRTIRNAFAHSMTHIRIYR